MKKFMLFLLILSMGTVFFVVNSFCDGEQIKQIIPLPKPIMEGGKPLFETLKDRQSNRNFSEKELSLQMLSKLLWAAFGINRPKSGMRTAPSAHNTQEIDIYVAMKKGLYLYDAKQNTLEEVLEADIRAATGK